MTLEVKIDHGKIVPKEPGKLPESGDGLLTILQPAAVPPTDLNFEAFDALQRSLNLDDAKAKAWMDAMRDARR